MKILKSLLIAGALATGAANASAQLADTTYTPSPENIQARQQFSDSGFGIFIHWGIYSMFAQGDGTCRMVSLPTNTPRRHGDSTPPISMPTNG